mmetsp:Transcript_78747/g.238844  ORF Transcript_78747/g.238844 Transcript_78747/m.238844 type:complete len:388 (+) Transcript_78747:729-1892(+)
MRHQPLKRTAPVRAQGKQQKLAGAAPLRHCSPLGPPHKLGHRAAQVPPALLLEMPVRRPQATATSLLLGLELLERHVARAQAPLVRRRPRRAEQLLRCRPQRGQHVVPPLPDAKPLACRQPCQPLQVGMPLLPHGLNHVQLDALQEVLPLPPCVPPQLLLNAADPHHPGVLLTLLIKRAPGGSTAQGLREPLLEARRCLQHHPVRPSPKAPAGLAKLTQQLGRLLLQLCLLLTLLGGLGLAEVLEPDLLQDLYPLLPARVHLSLLLQLIQLLQGPVHMLLQLLQELHLAHPALQRQRQLASIPGLPGLLCRKLEPALHLQQQGKMVPRGGRRDDLQQPPKAPEHLAAPDPPQHRLRDQCIVKRAVPPKGIHEGRPGAREVGVYHLQV